MTKANWIAVDWGTSHLRAWAMGADGAVLDRAASADGMGKLARDEFEPALLRRIEPWLGEGATPVIACGMVGAKQGWVEAPYLAVPCKPGGAAPIRPATGDPRLALHILPGICQSQPADVMRGEETQVAGYLARSPDFDGVICLPGTHTKWVHVSAGEIISFRTFMTGELFALLSTHSVLRHSVQDTGRDDDAFLAAVSDAMARPQGVAADLFALRAGALLHDLPPRTARSRLSGLLVGLELGGARPYWLGQRIALVGSEELTGLYAQALAAQGVEAQRAGGEEMTLEGLRAAHEKLRESME